MIINLNNYQQQAKRTWNPPNERPKILNLAYLALGLPNEAGEVAGKIKKLIRDNNCVLTEETRSAIADELGDTLWYLSMLCEELELTLEDVAARNIEKLSSRLQRGVINGNGDNR